MVHPNPQRSKALQLIILFGFVSLFGDLVYESARSVNGPYLKTLGANAALVGLIVGIGEFLGYAIRLVSGYFSDKTKAYWAFTFIGYGLLLSVPLMCLANTWQLAAVFIVLERFGKAIRNPARDTILSQATKQVGTGFGFGLHEAMDQIGAMSGPLLFSALFFMSGAGTKTIADYQKGYALLFIPFVLVMASIVIACVRVPEPQKLEYQPSVTNQPETLSRTFWLYTIFTFVTTLGFVNFALIGFHFKAHNIFSDAVIPLLYALAMAVDAVVALAIGKLYDRCKHRSKSDHGGLLTLGIIPLTTLFIPLFIFSPNRQIVIAGIVLWGVVMGSHETIMRSAIADITPMKKRGTGYGIFNTAYGLAFFVGSAGMGFLYDHSLAALVGASVAIEVIAVVLFLELKKAARPRVGLCEAGAPRNKR